MTKKEADYLLKRIYKGIKDNPDIYIKFDRSYCEGCYYGEAFIGRDINIGPNIIRLNPTKRSPLIRTVLHEFLHLVDWDWPDYLINRIEREIFNLLTDRQLTNLMTKLGSKIRWVGKDREE